MIQVELVETTLNGQTFFAARAAQSGQFTPDEMAQEIATRNIASPEIARAIIDAYDDIALSALLRGERVYLNGLGQLFLSLSGKFASPDASLSESKTDLNITFTVDPELVSRLRESAELHNAGTTNLNPLPQTLTGIHSNLLALKAGEVIQITGNRLYFHEDGAGEGVDFVPEGAGSIVHAPATFDKGEKKLNVFAPAGLLAGAKYRLRVSGRARNRAADAQLRSGTSEASVTAAP